MKKNLLILLTIASVFFFSTSVSAYKYTGYKLNGGITSGVMNNSCNPDGWNYKGTVYNLHAACNGALNEWNAATEMNIGFYTSGQYIKLFLDSGDFGNLDLFGWAEEYSDPDLNNIGTRISGVHGTSYPTMNYEYGIATLNIFDIDESKLTYAQYKAVAIHEAGHVLGLAHENNGTPSIMNENMLPANWLTPKTDDINGINALY